MGPISKILRAQLKHKKRAKSKRKAKCTLCSYQHSVASIEGESEGDESEAPTFCDTCCNSWLGLYTVWTAMDSFKARSSTGSRR